MKTVLLIDRFPIVRTGLRTLLADLRDPVKVVEGGDIVDFRSLHPELMPDLVVLAISQVPDLDNLEFLSLVKKWYPLARLIVHDQKPVQSEIPIYFKLGIHGYLMVGATSTELKECITEVLIGKKYVTVEVLNLILEAVPPKKPKRVLKLAELTNRENEIANYIGQGVRTSVIAETLGKKISTISTVKRNVYKKLHVNNIIELNLAMSISKASHKSEAEGVH